MNNRVVIIGAGFGGLQAAMSIDNPQLEITIIDKTNHHLFQPLLYQVATATLSPGDIAIPIRTVIKKKKNIEVLMDKVESIDRKNRKVICQDKVVEYDYLIVATGSRHSYFGNDHWEKNAPGLKSLKDALRIRENIIRSFETAEKIEDYDERQKYLNFVIVGGGPTGVEMAGAIAEISKNTMEYEYRNFDPMEETKVMLVEAADKILAPFDEKLRKQAEDQLAELGVEVLKNQPVTNIEKGIVEFGDRKVESVNIIWAAGNNVNGLLESLNCERDKIGRIFVERDCSIPEDENIFIIGDAAAFRSKGQFLPAIAPVAVQQGKYVANILSKRLKKGERKDFRYNDKGLLATIGRARAVAQIKNMKFSGFIAWVVWCFVHVLFLIGYRNRYKVLAEWAWFYFTYKHGIRLISGRK